MSKLEIFGVAALAVTAGVLYVLVHEARRKHKKAIKLAAEEPISKEMLLDILNRSDRRGGQRDSDREFWQQSL